jgi:hypothetical protein
MLPDGRSGEMVLLVKQAPRLGVERPTGQTRGHLREPRLLVANKTLVLSGPLQNEG